jgi:hypothetical protein
MTACIISVVLVLFPCEITRTLVSHSSSFEPAGSNRKRGKGESLAGNVVRIYFPGRHIGVLPRNVIPLSNPIHGFSLEVRYFSLVFQCRSYGMKQVLQLLQDARKLLERKFGS